ncbi:hypothetical protein, partial [Agrobacterium sp. P15N1-A]|uniref:hypothetical protein n=1 Tax=Agrobacterium sp. P15N1-A TaxID=3342820 RepID=UPI0037D3586C
CSSTEERRKGQSLDQSLITKPYSEVAHFSVEKPAQFCAETNIDGYLAYPGCRIHVESLVSPQCLIAFCRDFDSRLIF